MIISKDHIFKISKKILPFSDSASSNFSLLQLLRLSLFQVSVGMATVMLAGTLNRVMIVELLVPASLVAVMIAIPVLIAPMRTFYGYKSDTYKSFIGWKRIPYMWFGSLFQFGGLAVMPFAIIILSGDQTVYNISYAYGPITATVSETDFDVETVASDQTMSSYAISYTISDELSLTYGSETVEKGGTTTDAEYSAISASYTSGGMTISAAMKDAENVAHGTGSSEDFEYWSLGASFAF